MSWTGVVPAAEPTRPAHVQRGDHVESAFRAYRERLETFYKRLGARLQVDPELLARLAAMPPVAPRQGYQILPKLVPDLPKSRGSRTRSVPYAWPFTDARIGRERDKLDKLEARLARLEEATPEEAGRERPKLVDEYRALAGQLKWISADIEYNRLWQAEIARFRAIYNEQTVLHNAVIDRQELLDAHGAGDTVLAPSLWERAEALGRRMREPMFRIHRSAFLRIEEPAPRRWVLRMSVYTDIEDSAWLAGFQSGVEGAWRLTDGDDQFQLALEVRQVPVATLYPDGKTPATGGRIDVGPHAARFPPAGVVLTTGAGTTHVFGRSIVLGPQDIQPNVLAHELGHMLGFPDGYFRGYRDLGADGFEVLEVVIDPEDIMSSPGGGRVWRYHFDALLRR